MPRACNNKLNKILTFFVESQTIEYMGEWYLLDSEQFGGESVGCIADCVELVEGEKQLGDPGVDPAGRYVKCIKHFKYVKCIKAIKYACQICQREAAGRGRLNPAGEKFLSRSI